MNIKSLNFSSKRFITSYVTFPTYNKSSDTLKISLLKAPSHFGHYSDRVMRKYNEDRYSVNFIDLPIKLNDYGMDNLVLNQTAFICSIFDGHGGDECSQYLSENLHKEIESTINVTQSEFNEILYTFAKKVGGYWKRLYKRKDDIYENLVEQDEQTINQLNINDDLNLKLTKTYLDLDFKILLDNAKSGSTSTSVLIYNLNIRDKKSLYFNDGVISKLTISQIGDTKAIICDKDGLAHSLTSVHHPTSFKESQRLNKFMSGGFMTDSFGENRFLNYANTRSFGDLPGKSKGLSAEPDISSYVIGDSNIISKYNLTDRTIGKKGGDECFLVLLSDGVTNFATDQEIVDLVMSRYHLSTKSRPQDCSEEVVKYVEAIGGDDNATCLVIRLSNWGKWPNLDRTGKLREDKLKEGISRMERR